MERGAPEEAVGAHVIHMAQEEKCVACSQCNMGLSRQAGCHFFLLLAKSKMVDAPLKNGVRRT